MTLFKQRKPRGFHFQPRYYDANKEALQARIAEIERQVELEKNGTTDKAGSREYRMRTSFRSGGAAQLRQAKTRRSNIRVVLFAGILAAAFYLYLYADLETLF